MTLVLLFEEKNFQGSFILLQSDDRDLRNNFHYDGIIRDNWNDEASSVAVIGGSAEFYRDINFNGPHYTLQQGLYNLPAGGVGNNWISSVNLL
jgi:hypothetical protein